MYQDFPPPERRPTPNSQLALAGVLMIVTIALLVAAGYEALG